MYGTGITEIEKGGAERAGIRIDDDEVHLFLFLLLLKSLNCVIMFAKSTMLIFL